jgi:hypothetical protein
MTALPLLLACTFSLACVALVGGLLCRVRSIAGILERLYFDDALYARTLLIAGAPIGLFGWWAGRQPSASIQELGLILTVISTVIYAAVPLFVVIKAIRRRMVDGMSA